MKKFTLLLTFYLTIASGFAQIPSLIMDVNPGTATSLNNFSRIIYNSVMLYTANDNVHGVKLWSTDGTTANTFLVKDIYPGIYIIKIQTKDVIINSKIIRCKY